MKWDNALSTVTQNSYLIPSKCDRLRRLCKDVIFINQKWPWVEALEMCRDNYTDIIRL